MKLKSLFLATLAAMAMASCSNDNDPITDNGDQVEKNALLNLGFAFPKATATKATTEAGNITEYEFDKVAIIIKYTGGNIVVKELNRDDFSPATPTPDSDNIVIYTKQAIEVEAGGATIYAIVNPDKTATELEQDLSGLTVGTTYTTLGALAAVGGPAEANKFMMTSTEAGIEETFTLNQTTTVRIPVNRVVAKLAETTINREFTKKANSEENIETGLEGTDNVIKSITLKQATYVNLATSSKVFPTTTPAAWWQEYNRASTTSPDPADGGYSYFELSGSNVEYCFENSETNPTGIIYEAEVLWNDETAAHTFYIAAGQLYKSYDELTKAFRDCPKEDATPAEFAAASIRKYVDGKCYYYQTIKTNGTTESETIVRNNLYRLSVSGIVKIGSSTIIPDEDATLMNLSIEVQPWTVNENAFVLQ